MKKMNLRVAALLFCGAILTTSCQGLIDAIVGDSVARPTVPTTTPTTAKPNEAKVTIENEEYIISSLSELEKLMKELDEQLWGNSSEEDPVEVTITPGEDFAITDEDNTITLPFVDDANVVINITDDITTSEDKPLVIKSEKGKDDESNDVTINLIDDDDEEDDYLTIDMPSSNVSLESDKVATYDKVVSTADEITVGKGVTVEELEIEEGRYKETKDGGEVKSVTYNYNPIKIRETDAGSGDDDDADDDETDFLTDVELTSDDNEIEIEYEISEKYADEDEAKDIEIEWESDNPEVAEYDEKEGKIVAKGEDGFATITATVKGDEHAKTTINVSVEKTPKDISAIQPYTAGGDPLGFGGTPNLSDLNGKIKAAWEVDDRLIFSHDGVGGEDVRVAEVNAADGSARLNLSNVTRKKTGEEEISIVYPFFGDAVLSDGKNYIPRLPFKVMNNDNAGTLEYLAPRFDVRAGSGKVSFKDDKAKVVGAVQMKTQTAIWKLRLQDGSGNPVKARLITILSDGKSITEFQHNWGMTEVYLPIWGDEKPREVTVKVTNDSEKTYSFTKKNVTLAAGKYYESTLKLTEPPVVDLSKVSTTYTANDGDTFVYNGKGNGTPVTLNVNGNISVTLKDIPAGNVKIQYTGNPKINLTNSKINSIESTGKDRPTIVLDGANEVGHLQTVEGTVFIEGATKDNQKNTLFLRDDVAGTPVALIRGGANPVGTLVVKGGTVTAFSARDYNDNAAILGNVLVDGGTLIAVVTGKGGTAKGISHNVTVNSGKLKVRSDIFNPIYGHLSVDGGDVYIKGSGESEDGRAVHGNVIVGNGCKLYGYYEMQDANGGRMGYLLPYAAPATEYITTDNSSKIFTVGEWNF